MAEGIIFVNRGTSDCKAALRWAKVQSPNAKIISVCLENDPYLNLDDIMKLAMDENIEHFTIPFDVSFIASHNQNVEKAWQFDRHFKALQYQRRRSMFDNDGYTFSFVLSSLRGSPFETELIAILRKYIIMNQFTARQRIQMDSYIVYPFEEIQTDEELIAFLNKEGVIL